MAYAFVYTGMVYVPSQYGRHGLLPPPWHYSLRQVPGKDTHHPKPIKAGKASLPASRRTARQTITLGLAYPAAAPIVYPPRAKQEDTNPRQPPLAGTRVGAWRGQ